MKNATLRFRKRKPPAELCSHMPRVNFAL